MLDKFLTVVVVILVAILITLLVFAVVELTTGKSCLTSTADIGLPNRYSFWGGCQIEVTPGQWIPLGNYRYMEPK